MNCRSVVCYNPMTFSDVNKDTNRLRKEIGIPEHTPLVGTACRLAAVKNPIAFTKVMCRVLQMIPSAHAIIIGDGDDDTKQEMYSVIRDYHVSERFHWMGYRSDASDLVNELNCFVMTSYSEGLPTSILEAISKRTPFAMLEGEGGLKDIAELNQREGPLGIVVPQKDLESMALGICKVLLNNKYAEALADKAFLVAKRHFDISLISQKLYTIYKAACFQ